MEGGKPPADASACRHRHMRRSGERNGLKNRTAHKHVRMSPVTLRFSHPALERAYMLEDFRSTKVLVPIFSLVVCTLSMALIRSVPVTIICAPYIFPMFVTVGVVRMFVQLMNDAEHAMLFYCWSWTAVTS